MESARCVYEEVLMSNLFGGLGDCSPSERGLDHIGAQIEMPNLLIFLSLPTRLPICP